MTNNRASKNKNITVLYDNSQDTNACQAEEFETSSISYTANQLADPNSWDDEAHSISIFSTNDFININTANITTLLHRISIFIRDRCLNSRSKKDIPAIKAAWNLIASIYKSD